MKHHYHELLGIKDGKSIPLYKIDEAIRRVAKKVKKK